MAMRAYVHLITSVRVKGSSEPLFTDKAYSNAQLETCARADGSLAGPSVERADLRIERGVITAKGKKLTGSPVVDLAGRFVMPGMVCGHTHLYSALARGMPAKRQRPSGLIVFVRLRS